MIEKSLDNGDYVFGQLIVKKQEFGEMSLDVKIDKCWILSDDFDKFHEELQSLLIKYHI